MFIQRCVYIYIYIYPEVWCEICTATTVVCAVGGTEINLPGWRGWVACGINLCVKDDLVFWGEGGGEGWVVVAKEPFGRDR